MSPGEERLDHASGPGGSILEDRNHRRRGRGFASAKPERFQAAPRGTRKVSLNIRFDKASTKGLCQKRPGQLDAPTSGHPFHQLIHINKIALLVTLEAGSVNLERDQSRARAAARYYRQVHHQRTLPDPMIERKAKEIEENALSTWLDASSSSSDHRRRSSSGRSPDLADGNEP